MSAAVPTGRTTADEPQPGFVDQGCGLERVARRFPGHFMRRQFAQLFINQREQFLGRPLIALLDALEDLGDIAHAEWSMNVGKLLAKWRCSYNSNVESKSAGSVIRSG